MPNELRREQNIENAIAAAKQILLEEGAAKLTMQDVALRARISPRTLNRAFHSKDELIEMIALELCKNGFEKAKAYCKERHISQKNGLGQLQLFFESVKLHFPAVAQQIIVTADAQAYLRKTTGNQTVSNQHIANFKEYENLVCHLLERGESDGSIHKQEHENRISASLLVNSFWGLLLHLAVAYYNGNYTIEYCNSMFDEYTDRISRLLTI